MLSLSTAPSAIPPPQNQREAALIRRTLQGDRDAFTELVKPYERRVYAAALALLRNEADAEDIAQEAIVKAFTHLHQFRAEAKFSTWLIQITINQARMRQRKNHANLYDSLDDTHDGEEDYVPREFADWRETTPETLERKEIRALLAQALASLGEKYRSVFVLRDIEQLSIEETAKALAISVANVKTRLLRARLMLRDILAPALRDGWPGHVPFQKGEKPW